MIRTPCLIFTLLVCSFIASNVQAFVDNQQFSDIQYKDVVSDNQGYLSNTSGDAYLVLNNIDLTRAQMCNLFLTLEFKQAPEKASIFDVYWRTAKTGYSESQKGFFIINQAHAASKKNYIVPLCKLYGFSGNISQPLQQANITALRLDYPSNKDIALRIQSIQFLDDQALSALDGLAADAIMLEPYERISPRSFTSLDVIVPKLIFAFEEGIKRFTSDVPFLVFWLILILLLKVIILLSFVRQFKKDDK